MKALVFGTKPEPYEVAPDSGPSRCVDVADLLSLGVKIPAREMLTTFRARGTGRRDAGQPADWVWLTS